MRWVGVVLAVALQLGSAGCFSAKKAVLHSLPALPPMVERPLPEPKIEPTLTIALPLPDIEIAEVTLPSTPVWDAPKPEPAPRRRVVSTPGTPAPTVQTEAEPPPTAPTPAPEPTPQLGEILTDELRHQYEADFNGSVSRAHEAVNRTSGRHLTAVQKTTVQRINTFLQQAEASRVRDLVTALQLARRADLLGQDLLKSLQ